MQKSFGKLLTAMVTPFNSDLSVNYTVAADLAKYLVDNGSDGLVVAGSTGEAATLTKDEKVKLFETVMQAVGDKATVIAGTGTNDTKATIELTQLAEKVGVHGAMIVGPYYNKPPQDGLYKHFADVATATSLPLIVYNVPGRTASNILPSTIIKLSNIKNIVAVKEASGSLDQASEIIRNVPDDFMVYSGDDSLTLPMLAIGGCGVISVAGHIVGKRMQDMILAFSKGDNQTARKIHLELMPFFKVIFITTNPMPIKAAVNIKGLNAGPCRLPLVEMNAQDLENLKQVMHTL